MKIIDEIFYVLCGSETIPLRKRDVLRALCLSGQRLQLTVMKEGVETVMECIGTRNRLLKDMQSAGWEPLPCLPGGMLIIPACNLDRNQAVAREIWLRTCMDNWTEDARNTVRKMVLATPSGALAELRAGNLSDSEIDAALNMAVRTDEGMLAIPQMLLELLHSGKTKWMTHPAALEAYYKAPKEFAYLGNLYLEGMDPKLETAARTWIEAACGQPYLGLLDVLMNKPAEGTVIHKLSEAERNQMKTRIKDSAMAGKKDISLLIRLAIESEVKKEFGMGDADVLEVQEYVIRHGTPKDCQAMLYGSIPLSFVRNAASQEKIRGRNVFSDLADRMLDGDMPIDKKIDGVACCTIVAMNGYAENGDDRDKAVLRACEVSGRLMRQAIGIEAQRRRKTALLRLLCYANLIFLPEDFECGFTAFLDCADAHGMADMMSRLDLGHHAVIYHPQGSEPPEDQETLSDRLFLRVLDAFLRMAYAHPSDGMERALARVANLVTGNPELSSKVLSATLAAGIFSGGKEKCGKLAERFALSPRNTD